jgi:hypothetical protein
VCPGIHLFLHLPAIHAYAYTYCYSHRDCNCHCHRFRESDIDAEAFAYSERPHDTEAAADSAAKAVRGIGDVASLEFLTDRQDAVVEEARFIQTPTLESFTSNFFACCCSLVEPNSSSRRAGERHPVSQQSYARRSSH